MKCIPTCFFIETKLRERMKIPVFHDDQHGTAIVTAAAVINAFVHIIAAITAYQINPFKPKLNLQSRYQLETTA